MMTEPNTARAANPDRLSAVAVLVDECLAMLEGLRRAREEHERSSREQEWELAKRLNRLKGLAEQLLPFATDDQQIDTTTQRVESPQSEAEGGDPKPSPVTAAVEPSPATAAVEPSPTEQTPTSPVPSRSEEKGEPSPNSDLGSQPQLEALAEANRFRIDLPPARLSIDVLRDLRQRFSAYDELYQAGQNVKAILEGGSGNEGLRTKLDAVKTAGQKVWERIKHLADEIEIRRILEDQATQSLNQLQAIDEELNSAAGGWAGDLGRRIQDVRNHLWWFIQKATKNEYREVSPPENVDIGEWAKRNGYSPEYSYFTNSRVNSKYRKDHVVKTLQPGYVQVNDQGKVVRITAKAVVQISTGTMS